MPVAHFVRALQPELRGYLLHGSYADIQELLELQAKLLAGSNLLAICSPREVFLAKAFHYEPSVYRAELLPRMDERRGDDEAGYRVGAV